MLVFSVSGFFFCLRANDSKSPFALFCAVQERKSTSRKENPINEKYNFKENFLVNFPNYLLLNIQEPNDCWLLR